MSATAAHTKGFHWSASPMQQAKERCPDVSEAASCLAPAALARGYSALPRLRCRTPDLRCWLTLPAHGWDPSWAPGLAIALPTSICHPLTLTLGSCSRTYLSAAT